MQPQDQQHLRMMENLQQQQVLSSMQLQEQQQHQVLGSLQQQHQIQQQSQALGNLQQQQQQVLENLQQHLQSELLQPQLPPAQPAGELLTIQTSFPQQPPSHTSPPQQLFQSPRSQSENHSPQQQIQATLLQNTLTVLTGGGLNPEQQSAGSTLFLSPSALSTGLSAPQDGQQSQLAFLSSMETSVGAPQTVFQNQAQLASMEQLSTPMDQQQSSPHQQALAPQNSMFQTLPSTSQRNTLSQPQQAGLLLCTAALNPQTLLFSAQSQGCTAPRPQDPSPLMFSQPMVGPPQPDPAEPMSFQEQSSTGGHPASRNAPPEALFQEQQPMQVGPSSSNTPGSQQVKLFLPQASLSGLTGTMEAQDMGAPAPAGPATAIFVVQGSMVELQAASSTPGQRPPEQLFQTDMTTGQPNLFVFGLQNDSSQLLGSTGPSLSAQNQPILDQPLTQTATPMQTNLHNTMQTSMLASMESNLQTNLQTAMQTHAQTPMQTSIQATLESSLSNPMQSNLQTSMSNPMQTSMTACQTMEKIEDLLESLQDQ